MPGRPRFPRPVPVTCSWVCRWTRRWRSSGYSNAAERAMPKSITRARRMPAARWRVSCPGGSTQPSESRPAPRPRRRRAATAPQVAAVRQRVKTSSRDGPGTNAVASHGGLSSTPAATTGAVYRPLTRCAAVRLAPEPADELRVMGELRPDDLDRNEPSGWGKSPDKPGPSRPPPAWPADGSHESPQDPLAGQWLHRIPSPAQQNGTISDIQRIGYRLNCRSLVSRAARHLGLEAGSSLGMTARSRVTSPVSITFSGVNLYAC